MRNVQLLAEQVAKDKAGKMYGSMPEPEIVSCTPQDNLKRIDDLNHKLCNTMRRLDSIESQLRTHQRFVADMCGIAAIFMVLVCILVGYLIWRTAWL